MYRRNCLTSASLQMSSTVHSLQNQQIGAAPPQRAARLTLQFLLLPPAATAQAAQFALQVLDGSGGISLAGEDPIDSIVELRAYLVVLGTGHSGGARHGALESFVKRGVERVRRKHVLVLVQTGDGRLQIAFDRATLLLGGAGQILDQIGRQVGILGVLRHGSLPAAESRSMASISSTFGQRADADLVLDRTVRIVGEPPGVGPVAHEHRIAGLEHTEIGRASWRA